MRRLSWALVLATLLVPAQATAIPIIFNFAAGGPSQSESSDSSGRFSAFTSFWSADGAFGAFSSAFGMNGFGQRGRLGSGNGLGWGALFNGHGWGVQNREWAADFANASRIESPWLLNPAGFGFPITHRGWSRFEGPSIIGELESPEPVTPTTPAPPSITEVLEPSTLALLGTGLVVAGAGRYRRRRVRDSASRL
jgi:hypothetical protein